MIFVNIGGTLASACAIHGLLKLQGDSMAVRWLCSLFVAVMWLALAVNGTALVLRLVGIWSY